MWVISRYLLISVLIFLMILIKILILSFIFSGTVPADVQVGTGRKNTLNTSRNLLHRWLRLKDMRQWAVDQANDLSIIVGIGRELIMLLKCILVLIFLVLVAIVFVVAKLAWINQLCVLDMLCNKMRNYMCAWFS